MHNTIKQLMPLFKYETVLPPFDADPSDDDEKELFLFCLNYKRDIYYQFWKRCLVNAITFLGSEKRKNHILFLEIYCFKINGY